MVAGRATTWESKKTTREAPPGSKVDDELARGREELRQALVAWKRRDRSRLVALCEELQLALSRTESQGALHVRGVLMRLFSDDLREEEVRIARHHAADWSDSDGEYEAGKELRDIDTRPSRYPNKQEYASIWPQVRIGASPGRESGRCRQGAKRAKGGD